jgi:hypothetical protein
MNSVVTRFAVNESFVVLGSEWAEWLMRAGAPHAKELVKHLFPARRMDRCRGG